MLAWVCVTAALAVALRNISASAAGLSILYYYYYYYYHERGSYIAAFGELSNAPGVTTMSLESLYSAVCVTIGQRGLRARSKRGGTDDFAACSLSLSLSLLTTRATLARTFIVQNRDSLNSSTIYQYIYPYTTWNSNRSWGARYIVKYPLTNNLMGGKIAAALKRPFAWKSQIPG